MYSQYKVISRSIAALAGVFAWSVTIAPVFAAGTAERDLPANYEPGVSFTVSIVIDSQDSTTVILEDTPPTGWIQIDNISDGGSYDSVTHEVKFGPFLAPSIPTAVTYDITPPGGATGEQCFAGTVSFDGAPGQAIGGEDCVLPLDTPQACCLPDNTCEDRMEADCLADEGVPQGSGTVCTASEACCLYNGGCIEVDPLCCDEHGGIAQGEGTDCDPDPCPAIPTLSEWGAAAMTLLVLTAGTLVFRRRAVLTTC